MSAARSSVAAARAGRLRLLGGGLAANRAEGNHSGADETDFHDRFFLLFVCFVPAVRA